MENREQLEKMELTHSIASRKIKTERIDDKGSQRQLDGKERKPISVPQIKIKKKNIKGNRDNQEKKNINKDNWEKNNNNNSGIRITIIRTENGRRKKMNISNIF